MDAADTTPRVFAAVADGAVINTVLAHAVEDLDPDQQWVALDGLEPMPSIGWAYDGARFTAPPLPPGTDAPLPQPSKAELLAQLAALQAKIEALS